MSRRSFTAVTGTIVVLAIATGCTGQSPTQPAGSGNLLNRRPILCEFVVESVVRVGFGGIAVWRTRSSIDRDAGEASGRGRRHPERHANG